MLASFIILLREGLECFLILGIILGYLKKTDNSKYNKSIYIGSILAILTSIVCAILFQVFLGGYSGILHYMIEGFSKLFAVIILTFMLLWMKNASANLTVDLEKKLSNANTQSDLKKSFGLGIFAFVTIFKEGIEVTLFLGAISSEISLFGEISGSILGILTALLVVFIIFKTSINLNLKTFFKIMGGFIILIAAGLASGLIYEFQKAGVIPIFVEHLYNLSTILNVQIESILMFLHGIIGYTPNPSLLQVIIYLVYIIVISKIYFSNNNSKKNNS